MRPKTLRTCVPRYGHIARQNREILFMTVPIHSYSRGYIKNDCVLYSIANSVHI